MIPQIHEFPTQHVIVDEFYEAGELAAIWRELDFLHGKLQPADPSHAAQEGGRLLKQGQGLFLDHVYQDRGTSDILRLNRKLWTAIQPFAKTTSFSQIHTATADWTLISYYEDSDYYEGHADRSLITALTWFHREPKAYTGGDLLFSDFGNHRIEARNNRLLIFPGWVHHEVEPIRMKGEDTTGLGRYVMAQLLNYRQEQS
jgi:hypothetical protein